METIPAMPNEQSSYEPIRPALVFFVAGRPQTAGSKTAFTNPKTGKAIVTESGDRSAKKAWRADLRAGADAALDALYPDPTRPGWDRTAAFEVVFTFVRSRPKSHYGSGRNALMLKASAPPYPVARPDALKLARAVEDALTKIVWDDDSQIVDERLLKVWGDQEGVRVVVRPMRVPEPETPAQTPGQQLLGV